MRRDPFLLAFRGSINAIVLVTCCALLGSLPGCKPPLGAPPSLVATPRLLDVRATPAEAKPGSDVMLEALVVDPTGTLATPVAWTTCRTPKPPAESNAVNRACVDQPDDGAPLVGPATIKVPADACTLFGPLTPPMQPGQPASRPRDPDATGGFYQPFRAAARGVAGAEADLLAFALVRTTCPLANAGVEIARQFNDPVSGYHANNAPMFLSVTVTDDTGLSSMVVGTGAVPSPTVRAASSVALRVEWPTDSAETFMVFDVATRELASVREALRVSWFATAGELTHDRTGRDANDPELTSENTWRPSGVGGSETVHFWLVLGDSRGASSFAAFDLSVSP